MRAQITSFIVASLAATACFTKPARIDSDGGAGDDGPISELCFGKDMFTACLAELPDANLVLPGGAINTDEDQCTTGTTAGVVIDPNNGGPKLCVFAGKSVNVTGIELARGDLPLVIIATQDALTIASTGGIDVSSRRGQVPGAGANFAGCQPGTAAAARDGGYGGSLGTSGGNGGAGAGAGATAPAATASTLIRGGCPGGKGGNGTVASGAAGSGGGVVYLVAKGQLVIAGQVNASGEGGGAGTPTDGGGGGGGSGGLIALFSGAGINASGSTVWANGGGGGGGAAGNAGASGSESLGPTNVATGGNDGGSSSTAGADGAIGNAKGATAVASGKGAGGGGGGTGTIKNISGQTINGGMFSPPPTF